MPDISVSVPSINQEAYFTFKDPFNYYIKNRQNLNTLSVKLRVVSIINMKDMIRNDLRDPYTELYEPATLTEVDYKKDLIDNIPIVSFAYVDRVGVERFFRAPLNYIESISNFANIEYLNKLLVMDLNRLPKDLDLTVFFNDLQSFISSRLGVVPLIKEVGIGSVELIDVVEHDARETIRANSITVYKTLETQLEELQIEYNQLINRINTLGISLG